jgi:DNA-binding CsgD family transcriptional regulator/PAS domain-containing protein
VTALTESGLLQLVGLIYDAATEPDRWPVFLKAYAEATSCQLAALQIHHFDEHRSEILASFGMDQCFSESYNDYYSGLNTWREQGRKRYVQGQALSSEVIYPQRLLERTEFYNDYLRPMGGVHCTAAIVARDDRSATSLTAMRPEGRPPLTQSEVRLAEQLLPHLMRANLIRVKLNISEMSKTVLDNAPYAVVFLDENAKCIYANNTAEKIFACNDGLGLKSGGLHATLGHSNAVLKFAIQQFLSSVCSLDTRKAVLVERVSLRRSYEIVLAPISERYSGLSGKARIIGMISDPERQTTVAKPILEQLYGLTLKEAELANKLCEGKSIEEAAKDLRISYETARTHLRRVFSKTGVSRQSLLVLLLSQIPRPPFAT